MSEKAYEALEQARREALERQQICAYCGKVCRDGHHLIAHIRLRHDDGIQA